MDRLRRHFIIAEALLFTADRLEKLPDNQRPQSDIDDMRHLLADDYKSALDIAAGAVAGLIRRDDARR